MKTKLLLVTAFLFSFIGLFSQIPMPSLILTQPYLMPSSNSIHNYGPIETQGNFNVLQGLYTDLVSSQSITFKDGAYVTPQTTGPYANNDFKARIEDEQLELAWFAPHSPGWVERNDKLEVGINFTAAVENQIQNFIDHQTSPNTLTKLNPFNPDDIDVRADFYLKVGNTWVHKKKKYGFFYEDFQRNKGGHDPNSWDWSRLSTNYRFRIRMTPEEYGEWKCIITTKINGFGTLPTADFHFNCYYSTRDGFIKVHQGSKKFLTLNNQIFFPVGRVLQAPACIQIRDDDWNVTNDPYNCGMVNPHDPSDDFLYVNKGFPIPVKSYEVFEQHLTKYKDTGANFFRLSNTMAHYDIEFENLGNYYSRMHMGWEMDQLLDTLDKLKLKMYFTFSHGSELKHIHPWDWKGEKLFDWSPKPGTYDKGYCYGTELGINSDEFFTDTRAKKHFKNKLRYMMSRWGYSTSVAVIDMYNEVNEIDGKDSPFPVDKRDREDWQIEMHNYIKNVLGHKNHLIGVHHVGTSEIIPTGSGTIQNLSRNFTDNNVDIVSISSYQAPFLRDGLNSVAKKITSYYNKPFMFIEIGSSGVDISGTNTYVQCDKYIEPTKDFWFSAFTEACGTGLIWRRWDYSITQWNQYENLTLFLNSLNFNKYQESGNIENKNQTGEMQFRINRSERKIIGVIVNRTWNQFNLGGTECTDIDNYPDDAKPPNYLTSYRSIKKNERNDAFIVPINGPALNRYYVEYYRGLDKNLYKSSTHVKTSDLNGNLKLDQFYNIDDIVGVKIYPFNSSFLVPNDSSNKTKKLKNIDHSQHTTNNTEVEIFKEINNSLIESESILVYPNPSTGIFNIKVDNKISEKIESIIIINLNGEVIKRVNWNSKNSSKIDLSRYPSGVYILSMYGESKYYYKKIVKL